MLLASESLLPGEPFLGSKWRSGEERVLITPPSHSTSKEPSHFDIDMPLLECVLIIAPSWHWPSVDSTKFCKLRALFDDPGFGRRLRSLPSHDVHQRVCDKVDYSIPSISAKQPKKLEPTTLTSPLVARRP